MNHTLVALVWAAMPTGASTAPASGKPHPITAWSKACNSRAGRATIKSRHLRILSAYSFGAQADSREHLARGHDAEGIGARDAIPTHAAAKIDSAQYLLVTDGCVQVGRAMKGKEARGVGGESLTMMCRRWSTTNRRNGRCSNSRAGQ